MGRMKHGKPQPHANKKKVVPRKDEETKSSSFQGACNDENAETFRKRRLDTSQADRYGELPDSENSDEENNDYDETKDLDYVRKHYSGATSHFQFKDEKEWNQEIATVEGNAFLELDLVQLAHDMAAFCVYEKLHMSEMEDETSYCAEDLKDAYEGTRTTEERTISQPPKIATKDYKTRRSNQPNTSRPPSSDTIDTHLYNTAATAWNFAGLKRYRDKLTKSKRIKRTMQNIDMKPDRVTKNDSIQKNKLQQSSIQTNPNGLANDISIASVAFTADKDSRVIPNTDSQNSPANSTAGSCDSNITNDRKSTVTNSTTNTNDTSSDIFSKKDVHLKDTNSTTDQDDIDLDLLLGIPSASLSSLDTAVTKEDQPETGDTNASTTEVKELDDWLDSILD